MAGFRLLVWYGGGGGVVTTPEDRPQQHVGVTWQGLQRHLDWLLREMEQGDGQGIRKITVEVT